MKSGTIGEIFWLLPVLSPLLPVVSHFFFVSTWKRSHFSLWFQSSGSPGNTSFLQTYTLKLHLLCGSILISEHKLNMVYLYFCLYMYLFYLNSLLTYMYVLHSTYIHVCTSIIYILTEDGDPSSIQTQENLDLQFLKTMSEEKQPLIGNMIPMVSMRQWYM